MYKHPRKYTVTLINDDTLSLLNPDEVSVDRLISDMADRGVKHEHTNGDVTWYPPGEIQRVYFYFE